MYIMGRLPSQDTECWMRFFFLLGPSADLQIYWPRCLVLHHCLLPWHLVCRFYTLAITFCSKVLPNISKKHAAFFDCLPVCASADLCYFIYFSFLLPSLLNCNISCSSELRNISCKVTIFLTMLSSLSFVLVQNLCILIILLSRQNLL